MIPAECIWPRAELAAAWEALVRTGSLAALDRATPAAPQLLADAEEERRRVDDWVKSVAESRGLDADVVSIDSRTETTFVQEAAPALVVTTAAAPSVLVLVASGERHVELLARDRRRVRVPAAAIELAALGPAKTLSWEHHVVAALEIGRKQDEAVRALRRGVELDVLAVGYPLRLASSRKLGLQAQRLLPRSLAIALGSLLLVAFGIAGFYAIGATALSGQTSARRLLPWALLAFATIPIRLFVQRAQAKIALEGSVILQRRLFEGSLRLPLEWVRERGVGAFVSLIDEVGTVQGFAVRIGPTSLLSAANLVGGLVFIAFGPIPIAVYLLAAVFLGATAYLARRWYRASRSFTLQRMIAADDLVAKMAGHRTRIAQSQPSAWHHGEEALVETQLEANRALDRAATLLETVPRAWSIAALVVLGPVFLARGTSASALVIGVAGTMVFGGALQAVVDNVVEWGRLAIAWELTRDIVTSGAAPAGASIVEVDEPARARGDVVLDAHDVTYRYRAGGRPVLANASLRVRLGDRILIEGPSGGGKSTLASVLAGLRRPESGVLLVGGLDHHTQSTSGWRRAVAVAPQFHDNYVFLNTLRFNLLLGRPWPPSEKDMARARDLCVELGLGPLLAKMPGGLYQMVGDSGWQLSHGERSRIFVARALLQDADVVVFDESFGALDPETLSTCVDCVFRHGKSLMVIAHP